MKKQNKTKYKLQKADALDWFNRVIKCQYTCPANTNVPAYVRMLRDGDFEGAYRVNRLSNLFPAILGRVCPHPCEDSCRRGKFDAPVSICALKRAAADFSEKETELPLGIEAPTKKIGKKVAVVGSGPAGLACANDLAVQGYDVVIYEALNCVGGMLNVGIPPYRLPRRLIQQEVSRVMDALGVEIKFNTPIGDKLTISDLKKEYDAVFVALGAHKSATLNIEGEDLEGVTYAVEFMRKTNLGEHVKLGDTVIVIGGGDVAMDCARNAIRLGCKTVHITCLEARHEMPGSEFEVEEALDEGAILHNSLGPKRILGKNGKVTGLETIVCTSVFNEEGRFSPTFAEGSESVIEADNIIIAIGQRSDLALVSERDNVELDRGRTIKVDPVTLSTSIPGVFAGGDVATGPRLLIDAIAQGHKAAESIHAYLTHGRAPRKKARFKVVRNHKPALGYDTMPRGKACSIPVNKRSGFEMEVDLGLSKEDILRDATRCFQCQLNVVVDSRKCILCGGCVDVCPNNCISMVSLNRIGGVGSSTGKGAALVMNEEKCIRCGLCVNRCPTRAMRMVEFSSAEG